MNETDEVSQLRYLNANDGTKIPFEIDPYSPQGSPHACGNLDLYGLGGEGWEPFSDYDWEEFSPSAINNPAVYVMKETTFHGGEIRRLRRDGNYMDCYTECGYIKECSILNFDYKHGRCYFLKEKALQRSCEPNNCGIHDSSPGRQERARKASKNFIATICRLDAEQTKFTKMIFERFHANGTEAYDNFISSGV